MKKKPDINKFNMLLQKFRFVDPISPDIQQILRRSKSGQFKRTFRRTAGYSAVFAMIASLYFRIRRMGLPITIIKSSILAGLAAVILISTVTTGIYWYFLKGPAESVIREELQHIAPLVTDPGISTRKEQARDIAEPADVIEDRIGVKIFNAVNLPEIKAVSASDRMASILSGLRGVDRVINLRLGRAGKKSGMMLFGSLELMEGNYTLSARLVSIKDSKIIFYDTEIIRSESDIDGACDRLAGKIYSRIR
jgi:hypothetical protein